MLSELTICTAGVEDDWRCQEEEEEEEEDNSHNSQHCCKPCDPQCMYITSRVFSLKLYSSKSAIKRMSVVPTI